MIYLDHAASTPLLPEALEVLTQSMSDDFANSSSAHKLGLEINRKLEKSRDSFLRLLGCKGSGRIIFTSSATEANNTVIKGVLRSGNSIWISPVDHPSVVKTANVLKICGVVVKSIPLKSGLIDSSELLSKISIKDKMIVLTVVNSSSGSILDVKLLVKKIREIAPAIHIHIDGVQAFGKIPFSTESVDSVAISGHKIGGPKGIGALYLAATFPIFNLLPLLDGGGQQYGVRSSTVAAPLVFSFEKAALIASLNMAQNRETVKTLMEDLRLNLKKSIPEIIFVCEISSPYILLLILPGISSDIVLRHLEMDRIFVSSSSACSSKVKGVNEIYTHLGIRESRHKEVLRISLSHLTTAKELSFFVDRVSSCYKKLKRLKR